MRPPWMAEVLKMQEHFSASRNAPRQTLFASYNQTMSQSIKTTFESVLLGTILVVVFGENSCAWHSHFPA